MLDRLFFSVANDMADNNAAFWIVLRTRSCASPVVDDGFTHDGWSCCTNRIGGYGFTNFHKNPVFMFVREFEIKELQIVHAKHINYRNVKVKKLKIVKLQ